MNLYYWSTPQGNFGDDLNTWLWDRLLEGWRDWDRDVTLVGVGTILSAAHFPPDRRGRFLVVGSGAGYGAPPAVNTPDWDIRSVRGPRSARALGLEARRGIIDPAVMIADFPEYRGLDRGTRPIFVPHISSVHRHDWGAVCAEAGMDFVSPQGDARQVIGRIARAPLVLAESMHAAILADAFRVPWIPVAVSPTFNAAKWLDWAESLEIALETPPLFPEFARLARMLPRRRAPRPAPPGAPLPGAVTSGAVTSGASGPRRQPLRLRARLAAERLFLVERLRARAKAPPLLSDDRILADRKERYGEVLEGVRRDYRARA